MRWLDILFMRLRTLFRGNHVEQELDEELRFHLDRQAQRNLDAGMPPAEARAAALRTIGGVAQIQERCREARGLRYLEDLAQDLRYAVRAMRRSPAIACVAVSSLALGIGANTAVFSLIDAIMLKPLPVANPDRLITLALHHANGGLGNFSFPAFLRLQEGNADAADLFATNGVGGAGSARIIVPGGAEVEEAIREQVSGECFRALGVRAVLGRVLSPDDNRLPNGNPVAVISFGYWKRRFGLDPAIVGKSLTVNDRPITVIGVAPPEFFGVEVGVATDIWMPLAASAQTSTLMNRQFNFLRVLGRLRPGATAAQVRANTQLVWARQRNEIADRIQNPRSRAEFLAEHIEVEPAAAGLSRLRQQFSEPLKILLAIVGLVLLIACSNIANLQLARASARQREIAVRLAIGAGRARLIRQLLTESVLLALAGGVFGVAFAYWGCQGLLHFIPKSATPLALDLRPDARVLGYTLALSLLSGIVFGLAPAVRASRACLDAALKSDSRSVGYNPARRWLGRSLMVGQVTLSMLLLIGSGLFIRTLMKLQAVDLGFDRERVLTFGVSLPGGLSDAQQRAIHEQVVDRAASLPGVRAVSYSWPGPFRGGQWTTGVSAEGYTPRPEDPPQFDGALVGPRFFETMGIALLAGRDFTERDIVTAPKVAVVNESMARRFFNGGPAIGRRIQFRRPNAVVDAEIVGIVRDARYLGVREAAPPMLYAPILQTTGPAPGFELRAAGDPRALAGALRRELPAIQPGLRVTEPTTIDEQVNASLSRERMIASISGFFGAIALLLACIGVYGTMAYSVTRRTAEVGIRMTLGALHGEVLWMIFREALALVAVGIGIGAVAALGINRLIASLLFGLEPGDPVTALLAAAAMLIAAALACYLPARRAASTDPMAALRYE